MNDEDKNQNSQPVITNQQVNIGNVKESKSSTLRIVEKASAWTMIICALLFALIAILSVWGVFGSNRDPAWKSLISLGIITIAALVINIAARIYEGKLK